MNDNKLSNLNSTHLLIHSLHGSGALTFYKSDLRTSQAEMRVSVSCIVTSRLQQVKVHLQSPSGYWENFYFLGTKRLNAVCCWLSAKNLPQVLEAILGYHPQGTWDTSTGCILPRPAGDCLSDTPSCFNRAALINIVFFLINSKSTD